MEDFIIRILVVYMKVLKMNFYEMRRNLQKEHNCDISKKSLINRIRKVK